MCIYKCRNYICACQSHTAIGNYSLRVEITFCVWQSLSAFKNYSRACVHHSIRVNITHKSNFYKQSVVLTRMSVIITFVSVIITLIRGNIALCVYKSHSCVLISHFAFQKYTLACDHHIIRVTITLCM
jgi:hypothetical protein